MNKNTNFFILANALTSRIKWKNDKNIKISNALKVLSSKTSLSIITTTTITITASSAAAAATVNDSDDKFYISVK